VVGVCAAALALGGCGGGDSESASTTTATAPSASAKDSASAPRPSQQGATGQKQAPKDSQAGGSPGGGGGNGSAKGNGSSPSVPVKPPRVSSAPVAGTKAPAPGVKTVSGADDSVQTYGTEADEAARSEAALALAAYLDERRREDWASACEALAQRPKEQLEKLAKSLSAQGKEINGCAGAMAALGQGGTSGSPQSQGTTISEVLSLRTEGDVSGDPSYLIFAGPPGQTLYSMPMYSEDGAWKVGLAVAAELPL
jgi:hypothetical protein